MKPRVTVNDWTGDQRENDLIKTDALEETLKMSKCDVCEIRQATEEATDDHVVCSRRCKEELSKILQIKEHRVREIKHDE
jgi:hypothetical protein